MRRIAHALASLRWRLTLTFVGLLTLLLVLLAGYQYLTLRASLISNRVARDAGRLHVREAAARRQGDGARRNHDRTQASLRDASGRWSARPWRSAVSAVTGQTVQVVVYDRSLTQDAVAPAGATPPLLDRPPCCSASWTAACAPDAQQIITAERRSARRRLSGGRRHRRVRRRAAVGRDDADHRRPPRRAPAHHASAVLVMLLLALIIGVLLTGRTLRPMRRLTATAEQLAAGDLTARSRLTPSSDEVGQLASSFDHMADRIQEAFAAQQDSEAQVRRFIADASHELRTPVTALKGYIDVLRRGAGREPAALDAALEAMSNESERMRDPRPRSAHAGPSRCASRVAPRGLRPQRRGRRPPRRGRPGHARSACSAASPWRRCWCTRIAAR